MRVSHQTSRRFLFSRRFAPRMTLLQRFAITSLLVFVVLGFGLAYFLGQSVSDSALANARQAASDDLHSRLLSNLTPADLRTPMRGARYRQFHDFVTSSILSDRTVRVKVWEPNGTVIYSSDPRIVGKRFEIEDELRTALAGGLGSDVSTLSAAENRFDRVFGKLLEVYIPIRFRPNGPVVGAFEIYQRYQPVAQQIATLQHELYGFLGGGLFVLYVLLFGVVGSGSRTISSQQRRIVLDAEQLQASYHHTILALASAVDARDSGTELHSERVTALAVAFGRRLGLVEERVQSLERGALLHDVGKIGVRDAILLKPGLLTEEEWAEMRRHPEIGYRMLLDVPFLEDALPVVRHHHEHWDGSGYPAGLVGEAIPFEARLFTIIDAYDALTSDRPYRPALSHEAAMGIIRRDAGRLFDPSLVQVFEGMMAEDGSVNLREPSLGLRGERRGEVA